VNVDSEVLNDYVTWELHNASGLLNYTMGQSTLENGTYTLKVYYQNIILNQTSLLTVTHGNTEVDVNLLLYVNKTVDHLKLFSNTAYSTIINFNYSLQFDVIYYVNDYWYFDVYGFQAQSANITITNFGFVDNILTFNASAPSETTSTTKIYCGDKGKPESVSGATYSYYSISKILTLTVTHSSSEEVVIDWTVEWGFWWGGWWIIPILGAALAYLLKRIKAMNVHVLLILVVVIEDALLRISPIIILDYWVPLWSIYIISVVLDSITHSFKKWKILPKRTLLAITYNGGWYGLYFVGSLVHPVVGVLLGVAFHFLIDEFWLWRKKNG